MTSSYQLPSSLSSLHPLFTLLYISSTLSPSPAFNYHSSVIMLLHLVSICLLISFLAFSSSHSPTSSLVAPWGNEALRTWQRRHHAAQRRDSSAQITTQKLAIWCYFAFSLSTCHWGWYVVSFYIKCWIRSLVSMENCSWNAVYHLSQSDSGFEELRVYSWCELLTIWLNFQQR